MSSHDQVLEALKAWNSDETFYRGYYYAKQSNIISAFLEQNMPEDPELLEFVEDPATIAAEKTEEMFFADGRNISLVKHPRYLPVFEHRHTFFEILYVVSGRCRQIFPEKTVELGEGDCCLIAPGIRHAISVFDDSVVLNVLIRRSTFLDIFLNAVRSGSQLSLFFLGSLYARKRMPFMVYRTKGDIKLQGYILEMMNEQTTLDEYSDRIMCSLLTIFFYQLTRLYGKSVELPRTGDHGQNVQGNAMIDFIMNNYATVSIRSLAEHFHFAEPYCSKLIKDTCGSTFTELLTSIRMRRSENLLVHTQLSVEEISTQIGYKNPESFIRSFKRIYKVSPSQYRRDPDHVYV